MSARKNVAASGITKRQFMEHWRQRRTAAIHAMYKGDPHGPACIAASLVDVDKEGEALWRKHGKALRTLGMADVFADKERTA